MAEIEKQKLTSMNITDHQKEKLKELFPEAFTEGDKIDWDRLRLTLAETIDVGKERFGMNWPGKSECFKTIQQPSIATLIPQQNESIDFETTENLFIEGDNLEVLKLLQKSYLGKIKMIYIDPPYNTGNDFIYPDNFSESLQTYLEYTGQVDSEGRKFNTNTESDGRFHSKWLNMMYPRLFLARNLLKDDGVIFISIDDSEVSNLRLLCNELFGEENFIVQFIWKSRVSEDTRAKTGVSTDHEYILCYSKNKSVLRGTEKDMNKFTNPDNDPRGPWRSADLTGLATKDKRPNLHYDLVDPSTGINYGRPPKGWRFEPKTMNKKISEGRILFPREATGRPRHKLYLKEMKSNYKNISSIIQDTNTSVGTKELNELLGVGVFPFPKPVELIKILLAQATGEDDLVLDFFAGSCSTAQAVIETNIDEESSRKFICVQLPESLEENSVGYQIGYKNIAALSRSRIKKVITKFIDGSKTKSNLFNTDLSQIDLGFKSFQLTKSNFAIWDNNTAKEPEAIQKALFDHVVHISPEAKQEAILFELLLKSGFELTTPIEQLTLEGKLVYSIAEGQLLICLEKELKNEVIKAIAERQPSRVICLDDGFQNNDQLKTNAVQIMKSKGVLNFRTV